MNKEKRAVVKAWLKRRAGRTIMETVDADIYLFSGECKRLRRLLDRDDLSDSISHRIRSVIRFINNEVMEKVRAYRAREQRFKTVLPPRALTIAIHKIWAPVREEIQKARERMAIIFKALHINYNFD